MSSQWKSVCFRDVVELQRGHDLPATIRKPGTVPVIGSFGVTGTHDKAAYPGPGVAIGRSGAAIGTPTYVDDPFWPLNTCLFVRDFKGNDPRWVYQLLQTIDFKAFNSGSAQPSLNRNFLGDIEVALPRPAEQKRIAEVFGALDDKILANEHVIASAQSLMLAVVAAVDDDVPVCALATQSTASVKPGSFESSVAHFSLPAFDNGCQPDIAGRTTIKSNKFLLSKPSVLFSKLNPRIPRIWDVNQVPTQMSVASTEFVVLVPDGVSSSALWAALAQPEVSEALRQKVAGTSGSHQRVRPADLLGVRVKDVRELGESAAALVHDLGRICYDRRRESSGLVRTRDELLPLLMSGKVTVRAVEDLAGDLA